MIFAHRTDDYRHQILEISPPVPMEGETAVAFGHCVAAMDAAIRQYPAEWDFWFELTDLVGLGLIPDNANQADQAGDCADRKDELQQSSR
jgi:hypothetical protein